VAELLEVAAVAFGLAGVADLAAVVDELMGEGDPAVLRNHLHQFLLDFLGRVAFGEAEAVGDAEDMGVDHDAFSFAEADTEDDVGGFAGGAGDGDELGEGLGDLTVEIGDDFAGSALDGFCLVVVEAGGADEGFELGEGLDIAAGVGKRLKSAGVTMLTRTSVHWAERMVATSSSQGER